MSVRLPYLKIINKDFLTLRQEEIFEFFKEDENILLFGNIPYHISTEIFLKFLEINAFKEAYFMTQQEFFKTIIAKPNSKTYSSISVLFQSFCEIKKLFSINRLNFFPKPSVDSIFLSLKKIVKFEQNLLKDYSLFVKKCFSKPRKTLWNNLVFNDFSEETLSNLYLKNNFEKNIRIHQLAATDILKIFSSINS